MSIQGPAPLPRSCRSPPGIAFGSPGRPRLCHGPRRCLGGDRQHPASGRGPARLPETRTTRRVPLLEPLLRSDPGDGELQGKLGRVLERKANVLDDQGQAEAALHLLRQAADLARGTMNATAKGGKPRETPLGVPLGSRSAAPNPWTGQGSQPMDDGAKGSLGETTHCGARRPGKNASRLAPT